MATGYYLQDNPNPNAAQFGWPRSKLSGVIGVHTAENNSCFNGPDPGDADVARFIAGRSDYGSYHVLADADSINPLVHPYWAAWADTTNNAHAMSVSAAVRANDWGDLGARADQVVRNMAVGTAQMVLTAVEYGLLDEPTPARRISAAEAISGSRAGFYGHGETNPGSRYDPGAGFNWGLFLKLYDDAISGGGTNPSEDELNKDQDAALGVVFNAVNRAPGAGSIASQGDINIVLRQLAGLTAAVQALAGKQTASEVDKSIRDAVQATAPTYYVKSEEDASVYALDVATGTLRPVTLAEWNVVNAAGISLRVVPQKFIDAAPKAE